MNGTDKVARIITGRIIDMIESGVLDWKKGWDVRMMPRSYARGRKYSGINLMMLYPVSMRGKIRIPYRSPYWLTFNDVQKIGGRIKEGERSRPVIFWKPTYTDVREIDTETGEEKVVQKKRGLILRYYNVWNWEQTEGIAEKPIPTPAGAGVNEGGEGFLKNLPAQPQILDGSPGYIPTIDIITMPPRSDFHNTNAYYETLFHEVTHWTGHKSRLNRAFDSSFGSDKYAREELVAELGASFICSIAGIEQEVDKNHAAYIQGWLKRLKEDPRLIIVAAGKACQAVDWCMGITHEENGQVPVSETNTQETAEVAA